MFINPLSAISAGRFLTCGRLLGWTLLAGLFGAAFAGDSFDTRWRVHGFIAQGLIDVDHSNYVNDDGELSAELTEIGLNASYQLSRDFRLTGQAVYLNGGNRYHEGARIDYLLLDWSAYSTENTLVNFYFGRFKNNHWLYSSTRDVPQARPSIILPQSIYFDGFRDIAEGGEGLDIKVSYSSDELGDFDFNLSSGTSDISKAQTQTILSEFASGRLKHDYDLQASLYWRPFYSPWRFGLSLLDSDFSYHSGDNDAFLDADIILQRYFLNALYQGEFWEFSAELLQDRFVFDDFYFPGFHQDNLGQGMFLQGRYKADSRLTFLVRYERFYINKDDKNGQKLEQATRGATPAYFGYQNSVTLGVSYDILANLRFELEHHWFEGTARLTPVVLPDARANSREHWSLWALQLMYWF
ncbi:hypothetical protein SG34_025035 [Thalassomonas viridans]|uniref:Phosphate-selective porin O and P n=1 Tax=Thalassomonas viridans TaxID=137584 RepID=A0AAF0C8U8_9GAMM|nr:hypothetical protein [Thalassomonas viridans]WDE04560.1 hypothetical protein SG34_025035 [Thalassomonas viridans]